MNIPNISKSYIFNALNVDVGLWIFNYNLFVGILSFEVSVESKLSKLL